MREGRVNDRGMICSCLLDLHEKTSVCVSNNKDTFRAAQPSHREATENGRMICSCHTRGNIENLQQGTMQSELDSEQGFHAAQPCKRNIENLQQGTTQSELDSEQGFHSAQPHKRKHRNWCVTMRKHLDAAQFCQTVHAIQPCRAA
eukprot:1161752-Pelagomonas_calceolata.AAC.5